MDNTRDLTTRLSQLLQISNDLFIASFIRSSINPSEQNARMIHHDEGRSPSRIISNTAIPPYREIVTDSTPNDDTALYDDIDAELDLITKSFRQRFIKGVTKAEEKKEQQQQEEVSSTSPASPDPSITTITDNINLPPSTVTPPLSSSTQPPTTADEKRSDDPLSSPATALSITTSSSSSPSLPISPILRRNQSFNPPHPKQWVNFIPPSITQWSNYSRHFANQRLQPVLSPAELELYETIMKADPTTRITPEASYGTCLVSHLQTLKDGRFLNDEIINCYIRLLDLRSIRRHRNPPRNSLINPPKIYFFTTFFFAKLFVRYLTYTYREIDNLIHGRACPLMRAGETIFSYDVLFFPVNYSSHWTLITIDFRKKKISSYDSLSMTQEQLLFKRLVARFLCDEYYVCFKKEMNLDGWNFSRKKKNEVEQKTEEKKNTPADEDPIQEELDRLAEFEFNETQVTDGMLVQENGYDCGVFMLTAADFLSMDALMGTSNARLFTQQDCIFARKRIALELYIDCLRGDTMKLSHWTNILTQGFNSEKWKGSLFGIDGPIKKSKSKQK